MDQERIIAVVGIAWLWSINNPNVHGERSKVSVYLQT